MKFLALIPSPGTGVLQLGPLKLNAYGAMIALGVVAAVWLSGRRLEKRGAGTREDMSAIALWGVPAGVIGGRLYHVVTDWELFSGHPERIVQIWKGGLGIWGGIFLGVIVGLWEGRRRGISASVLMTCVAPALPLAQSIGRWGNWFNQELFGRPTTLPWGLEVSDFHTKQAGYPVGTLFHPTFLYESLACLALCGLLLLLDKSVKRPGYLFLYYTAGYTLFRFFIEGLRIDPAHSAGGLRLNQWVSIVVFAVSVSMLVLPRSAKSDSPAEPIALRVVSTPSSGSSPARITSEVVAKVAKLSSLHLSDAELALMTTQLSGMLDHFADIDKLDLSNVAPLAQPFPLKNVFREDVVVAGLDRDEVLAAAPAAEDGRFRVPPSLGLGEQ